MPRHSPNPAQSPSADKNAMTPPGVACRVGETIIHSGIYRVRHAGHRVSHYVVLLSGQTFPRCARCADQVRFELFQATPEIHKDPDFRVQLYEIPHPPPAPGEEEKEDEVA